MCPKNVNNNSRQAKERERRIYPPVPEHTEEDMLKAGRQDLNDRAIALPAESVKKSIDQTEAVETKAGAQRLIFLA